MVIIIVIVSSVILFYHKFRGNRIDSDIKKNKEITMLIVVHDGKKLLFSELFFYHPETKKGAILDFPRNLGTIINAVDNKINSIDVLYKASGILRYKSKLEELIDNKIPYYLEIESSNIEYIVDLLDGLEIFIADPVENLGEELVLLPSGNNILDGKKVKTYATYRDKENDDSRRIDIGEIGRHCKFIQILLKRMGDKFLYLNKKNVLGYFKSYIKTNLNKMALKSFMEELKNLNTDHMVFQHITGNIRKIEVADENNRMERKNLIFPHHEGQWLIETVRQIKDSIANKEIEGYEVFNTAIKILNGTKINGLAGRTSKLFQSFGYNVAEESNAGNDEEIKTVVLYSPNCLSLAEDVGKKIKCGNIEPMLKRNKLYPGIAAYYESVDIIIVLGKDFDGRYCR